MKYLDRTLGVDEKVIHVAKLDWMQTFKCVFFTAATVVTPLFVDGWQNIAAGIFGYLALIQFINIKTTEMFVTNKRIGLKEGWIARKTQEISVDAYETTQIEQSFLGRILRCGVKLVVTGRGTQQVVFGPLGSEGGLEFKAKIENARKEM